MELLSDKFIMSNHKQSFDPQLSLLLLFIQYNFTAHGFRYP